jgi:serine acetyltransferase
LAPIVLERNVWLGDGVIVCKGVRIGENSVVGAGSVVASDLPSNVIAAGNPARVMRELDPAERIVTRSALFTERADQIEARNAFLRFYVLCGNTFAGWLRARLFPRPTD